MVDKEKTFIQTGRIIESGAVDAKYILLQVGKDDLENTDIWQAHAVDQLNHRLWVMPKTTAEVEHEAYAGRIVYAHTYDWPQCKDYYDRD